MEHTLEMTLDPIWDTVDRLHVWPDQECPRSAEQETLVRLLKLTEEVGQVARMARSA
ncbi:hypothetical protein [Streptomyces albipurpureus]|uniref:Uncharacterized protein n=1 Tax=Streptomyces albipurpureus TaxID=2897419 RepID=A0ABT0USN4_9ACTN|nr:hypothetical protein [Streptomyces sp. CWNU-1]MCM2390984.1 hypothetical protein [Streptomyces sp. CWNU-1]